MLDNKYMNKPRKYDKPGKPTKMTPETIAKLEEIFALGGTDTEATFYAGINLETLYAYQRKNPDYVKRKEALKETPVLKARRLVVNSLSTNLSAAQWYLEKKKKDEFSSRQELTGKDGKDLMSNLTEEEKRGLDNIRTETP